MVAAPARSRGMALLGWGDRDGKLDGLAAVDGTGGAYAWRADGDRHLAFAFLSGRRAAVVAGDRPGKGRVVEFARSKRRQHRRRRLVEPDFRSGGEQKLDVRLNAVPRLVRSGTRRRQLPLAEAKRASLPCCRRERVADERLADTCLGAHSNPPSSSGTWTNTLCIS